MDAYDILHAIKAWLIRRLKVKIKRATVKYKRWIARAVMRRKIKQFEQILYRLYLRGRIDQNEYIELKHKIRE